ncbi:hypothetical protein Gpo141_00009716 [Globisporangium polare]
MVAQVRPVEPSELPPRPTGRANSRDGGDEVFWDVPPATYRLVWLTLLLLYVSVTIYLLSIAGGYYVLLYMPSFSYYAATFHLIPVDDIPVVIVLYAGVIGMYTVHIGQFGYYSLRYRMLMFPAALPAVTRKVKESVTTLVFASQSVSPRVRGKQHHQVAMKRLVKSATTKVIEPLQREVLSTSGICGVRGVFFEPVVLLREVVEIAIQTAQAYQCSKQTNKLWINATFAALIVANCYSSPLLHRFGKSSEGAARVTVLGVDLVLDLVWFAVIPTLLWFPYFAALFKDELVLYRDTYIIEGIMELPALFVTSLVDGLVKLWPPVSIYFTMKKVELLTRQMRKSRPDASFAVNSKRKLPAIVTRKEASASKKCGFTRERVEKYLRVLLLCWGHTIAVVHVYATFIYSPSCSPGCQLVLRPWFRASGSCDCAALEINCLELEIEGSANQIRDVLSATYSRDLLNLIITHCPALHVPPAIRSLNNLYGLVLFNCTIEAWDTSAVITNALYPHLGHVLLVHTFVSEIPQALLHGDLPSSLVEIGLIATNLSALPDNLDRLWPHVSTLHLDHGNFSEYPTVLAKMPGLETISLYGNQISSIPHDALRENRALRFFVVTENPLSALPSSLKLSKALVRVLVMWTDVEDASSPLMDGDAYMLSQVRVYGFQSPVCGANENGTSVLGGGSDYNKPTWLHCDDRFFTYMGERSYGYYPLEAKLAEKKFVPKQQLEE